MGQKSSIRYYAGEFLTRAKNFIRHPITQIVIGVCIGMSAIAEIVQSIEENRHYLGGHHGLLIFGIGQIFVALGDLREALQQSAEALEKSHLLEEVARIEEKVVAEAMQIEQKVIELGQTIFTDETAANSGVPQAGETVDSVAVASSVVALVSTATAGSAEAVVKTVAEEPQPVTEEVPPPLYSMLEEEPVAVQVPVEVAPVAVASSVVALVSTGTAGSAEAVVKTVAEEPQPVAEEVPPPIYSMLEEEPVAVQVPVEVAPAAPVVLEPLSLPSAAEVPSFAPAEYDRVPGPRPVAIQPGRVVLNFPGLFAEGPNGSEALVQRLLAVPGVERVESGGDAVTMYLVGGATPGPGLLKATAAALREVRTGALVLPN